MCRFKSFLRVHVFWMSSSRQNPHVKEPFCLGVAEDEAASLVVSIDEASSSRVVDDDLMEVADLIEAAAEDPGRRPSNLAVRADTLEMRLPATLDVSEDRVRMLAVSNKLAASSDLTDERVLDEMTEAPSCSVSEVSQHESGLDRKRTTSNSSTKCTVTGHLDSVTGEGLTGNGRRGGLLFHELGDAFTAIAPHEVPQQLTIQVVVLARRARPQLRRAIVHIVVWWSREVLGTCREKSMRLAICG